MRSVSSSHRKTVRLRKSVAAMWIMRRIKRWSQKKHFSHFRRKKHLSILIFLRRHFPEVSERICWIWSFHWMQRCRAERRNFCWSFVTAVSKTICFWKNSMIKWLQRMSMRRIITLFWSMQHTMFLEEHPMILRWMMLQMKYISIYWWASVRSVCQRQGLAITRKRTVFRTESVTGLLISRTKDSSSRHSTTEVLIFTVCFITRRNQKIFSRRWSTSFLVRRCRCLRIHRKKHSRWLLKIHWEKMVITRLSVTFTRHWMIWSKNTKKNRIRWHWIKRMWRRFSSRAVCRMRKWRTLRRTSKKMQVRKQRFLQVISQR